MLVAFWVVSGGVVGLIGSRVGLLLLFDILPWIRPMPTPEYHMLKDDESLYAASSLFGAIASGLWVLFAINSKPAVWALFGAVAGGFVLPLLVLLASFGAVMLSKGFRCIDQAYASIKSNLTRR